MIQAVRGRLPAVHRYYDLRRRKMRLKDIHHYDTYVPILTQQSVRHTWDEAVQVVLDALQPLGDEYTAALAGGLRGRWCDRYPNRGKQSGAFSSGSFDADPYILMNYKPDVLEDVFTLAHEAGHSMHSYYSARRQPFQYYSYTIFVAEVASTFNEQLLCQHMLQRADDAQQRAYLINREIDSIRATIVRQTMFAEFEKMHARDGRSRSAADGADDQGRVPNPAGAILRSGFRVGRRTGAGVLPDPALLPGVLRVQVRHRSVGRDRAQPPGPRRRIAGIERLLEFPPRPAARRTRWTCSATQASIWPARRRSKPPWSTSSSWSPSWTSCCNRP